jgi:3-oxoacyl-[acyl-carrier-protein] synthase II
MRRVVITGIGAISPHGLGAPAFWNGLLESKSSIAPLTRFDPSAFESRIAAVIPPFKTADFVPKSYRKAVKIMARDIELAVVAADFAVRDAKLITRGIAEGAPEDKLISEGWFKVDPARMGCNIGAGLICADLDELTMATSQARNPDNTMNLAKWGKSDDPTKTSGMESLTPLWLLKYLPNMLACHVSIIHDTQGPSNTITCSQASAGLALAEAARTIQRNHADVALAGGCESKVHPMGLMRWSLLRRLNGKNNDNPAIACRPYDKSASGAVLSEGGAVFVIEEYEHAKRRGATIYAEIIGFGASANAAVNPIDPDPSGEAPGVAMKKSFKDAHLQPQQIDLVIPSSYSVPDWDRSDINSLRYAFGDSFDHFTLFPARAGMGDCGAGSQALDLAAAAMCMHQQTIPPAANITDPVDNLPIPRHKITKPIHHALILSAALGGQNSSVIFKKFA